MHFLLEARVVIIDLQVKMETLPYLVQSVKIATISTIITTFYEKTMSSFHTLCLYYKYNVDDSVKTPVNI